jgi:hypothetical protein
MSTELIIVLVVVCVYVKGLLLMARRSAIHELDDGFPRRRSMRSYAEAGIWGLCVGAVWPLLAIALGVGLACGWVLTRGAHLEKE